MATKKFSDYAIEGQNVTLTYDNVNDTVTFDVVVDKNDVGLGNVDNTSDANKPVSTAQQTALNLKQNNLVSGTNIKTLNSNTLLGSGDLVIDKTSVGLSNVANVDTTNATNITSGTLADARLTANVTTQGNTFNTANKLVQLDGTAKLPAIDGSQLTNLPTPTTPTLAAVTTAGNTTTNAISVGGLTVDTNTLFVDATNNRVGIGTTTPLSDLHIVSSLIGLRVTLSNGNGGVISNDSTTTYFQALTFDNNVRDFNVSGQNLIFRTGSASYTERLRIFANGNLAIGTPTDAGYKLDVNGTARVQGDLKLKSNSSLSTGFNTARTSLVSTDTSGNGAFFDLYGSSGTAGTVDLGYAIFAKGVPSAITNSEVLEFRYDKTLRRYSMNSIAFGTGTVLPIALYTGTNTNQLSLFTTGNVAINTATDAGYKLDVNGTARVKGTGTTSATIPFTIQNSSGTDLLQVFDNGRIYLPQPAGAVLHLERIGGYSTDKITINRLIVGSATMNASAILQAESTVQGFLPPRMTTTQKNAIATPAAGLVVYDTTLGKLCVRTASAWETITSV